MIANLKIFDYSLVYILLYFSLYSFLGWCLETTFATYRAKHFVNRGFLFGPFCPMYGFTAVSIIMLAENIDGNYIKLYIVCFLGASIIEYITGFVLEALFDTKWWDYSNRPLNLKGRICLLFSFYWGLVGVFLIKILQPILSTFMTSLIDSNASYILFYLLIIYFALDAIMTLNTLLELKRLFIQLEDISTEIKSTILNLKEIAYDKVTLVGNKSKDRIAESDFFSRDFWNKREVIDNIPKELKERYDSIVNRIASRYSRLFNAFPHLSSKKLRKSIVEIREKIKLKVR